MTLGTKSLGFRAYLATQFLGAFNDNAFRFTFVFYVFDAVAEEAQRGRWIGLSQLLFAVPFIVFVALAGSLADRWAKSRVIRGAKLAEIAVMAAGLGAFALESLPLLAVVLFAMATQSAFFGPAKYGYLAETMAESDLVRANALVQLTTMLAIVAGQLTAGWIHATWAGDLVAGASWFVVFAVAGTLTSLGVAAVSPARPGERLAFDPLPELRATWRGVRADRTLLYSLLGNAHYFFLVAALQINLAAYGETGLGAEHDLGAVLVATATVFLGVGSLLASRWSEGHVELGLVPLGALAMTAGLVLLAIVEPVPLALPASWIAGEGLPTRALVVLGSEGLWSIFAATALLGVAGGLYVVPLWALIQQLAPQAEKGRYLAFANMVGFVGIALSALALWLPRELRVGFAGQFFGLALIALVGTVVSLRLQPFAFVRLLSWLLAHSCYSIRVRHAERLPERGGVLLLVNHVSWVDALVIGVSTRRKIHFLMYRRYYEWWPTHWLFRLLGCIPVASGDDPAVTAASLSAAGELLDQGRVVAIFGEGEVTRLGHLLPFRTGYQRVIQGRDAVIVPAYLGGLWGSVLSHQGGRFLRRVPRLSPRPVLVTFGPALPADTPPAAARAAIRALSAESWAGARRLPVHLAFAREARCRLRRCLADGAGAKVSPAALLARAELLAPRLALRLGDAKRVAVALPPGLDSVVAQLALLRAGRVPVLLDPAWDADRRERAAAAAVVEAWLVSDEPLPGAGPGADDTPRVALSPLLRRTAGARVAWRMGRNLLLGLLPRRRGGGDTEALAAVVFDTDGAPRPIAHRQLAAQVDGLQQVFDPHPGDGVLALLPPGSAFALATSTWLPLIAGMAVSWVADPRDGRAVGRAALASRATLVFTTPEVLSACVSAVRPDAFGGVHQVVVARGELDQGLAHRFADRFGLAPQPAWAPDGCAGLATVNTQDVRQAGVFQRGSKAGSVGHPVPGVQVVVRDPATGREQPPGASGRLELGGACVAAAAGVDRRGHLDAEGFLTLDGPSI